MVVITLVAILGLIGMASFRKVTAASKSGEAIAVIQALRAAEESYRAENQDYLNVSSSGTWYPTGSGKVAWGSGFATHADGANFQMLNAAVPQPVQYRFLVNAGAAGATLPTPNVALPAWPATTASWYVIQARADADLDGTYSNAIATSFTSEVYVNNEGE
jgi:type II secretory pathway pseudopilin PulG